MIAALICAVFPVVLLQSFIAFCRLALGSSWKIELSPHVKQLGGVEGKGLRGDDFELFVELVRLCPPSETGGVTFRAIKAYYGMLSTLTRAARGTLPALARWADGEQRRCSHFAAAALDRRISLNRGLVLEQGISHL